MFKLGPDLDSAFFAPSYKVAAFLILLHKHNLATVIVSFWRIYPDKFVMDVFKSNFLLFLWVFFFMFVQHKDFNVAWFKDCPYVIVVDY